MVTDRLHQVCLTKPDATVNEEWIVRSRGRLSYGQRRSVREVVGRPNHKRIERVLRVQLRIRWIARNEDQQALGLVLPATAEHKGYSAELEKGNIRIVDGDDAVSFNAKAGLLAVDRAIAMKQRIADILDR